MLKEKLVEAVKEGKSCKRRKVIIILAVLGISILVAIGVTVGVLVARYNQSLEKMLSDVDGYYSVKLNYAVESEPRFVRFQIHHHCPWTADDEGQCQINVVSCVIEGNVGDSKEETNCVQAETSDYRVDRNGKIVDNVNELDLPQLFAIYIQYKGVSQKNVTFTYAYFKGVLEITYTPFPNITIKVSRILKTDVLSRPVNEEISDKHPSSQNESKNIHSRVERQVLPTYKKFVPLPVGTVKNVFFQNSFTLNSKSYLSSLVQILLQNMRTHEPPIYLQTVVPYTNKGDLTYSASHLYAGIYELPGVHVSLLPHQGPISVHGVNVLLKLYFHNSKALRVGLRVYAQYKLCYKWLWFKWCILKAKYNQHVKVDAKAEIYIRLNIKPVSNTGVIITPYFKGGKITHQNNFSLHHIKLSGFLAWIGYVIKSHPAIHSALSLFANNIRDKYMQLVSAMIMESLKTMMAKTSPIVLHHALMSKIIHYIKLNKFSTYHMQQLVSFFEQIGLMGIPSKPVYGALACHHNSRIVDECMADWGNNAAGDSLQLFCVNGVYRACLSGEHMCPWRSHASSMVNINTCSRYGLNGGNLMAKAWCKRKVCKRHCWKQWFWTRCKTICSEVHPNGETHWRGRPTYYYCNYGVLTTR